MQEDFSTYSVPFLIGMRADSSLCQIDSYVAEGDISFGSAVKRGTDKSKQCLALDNIDAFLGVALRNDLRTEGIHKAKSMVSVMTKGRVVVKVAEAVVAGDKAYVHADGSFNKTADSGYEIGIFASNQASENELVILEIK